MKRLISIIMLFCAVGFAQEAMQYEYPGLVFLLGNRGFGNASYEFNFRNAIIATNSGVSKAGTVWTGLSTNATNKVELNNLGTAVYSNYTIGCWFKQSAAGFNGERLMDIGVNKGAIFYSTSGGGRWAVHSGNGTTFMLTKLGSAIGSWTHIAAACNGATVTIYVNGMMNTNYTGSYCLASTGQNYRMMQYITSGNYGFIGSATGFFFATAFWNHGTINRIMYQTRPPQ